MPMANILPVEVAIGAPVVQILEIVAVVAIQFFQALGVAFAAIEGSLLQGKLA